MIVTLNEWTPVERFDGVPWITARLDEASSPDGPWTQIDMFELSPVDDDPVNPQGRLFTSENATIQNGWYRIGWLDVAGNESDTPPIQNLPAPRAYRPLVSDVGAWLRSRTVDKDGNENGTFTATTRPTYEQADRVIDSAMASLEGKFGPAMQAELVGTAARVVALLSAMQIELTFFADQITPDRSPYDRLKALYEETLTSWDTERVALGTDGTPDTPDDGAMPSYSFPPLTPPRFPGAERPWGGFGGLWP